MNGSPRVSVVIPTLNEERNIPHVLSGIPEGIHEVILVDGMSVDNTVEIARRIRPNLCVVSQTRIGKGNALACGFEVATGDVSRAHGRRGRVCRSSRNTAVCGCPRRRR